MNAIQTSRSSKKVPVNKLQKKELSETNLFQYMFTAKKEHLYSELKSEGVILSLSNGKYYGVNEVGTTIWKAMLEPISYEGIQQRVLAEFDTDAETCRPTIISFLRAMLKEELIEISDAEVN